MKVIFNNVNLDFATYVQTYGILEGGVVIEKPTNWMVVSKAGAYLIWWYFNATNVDQTYHIEGTGNIYAPATAYAISAEKPIIGTLVTNQVTVTTSQVVSADVVVPAGKYLIVSSYGFYGSTPVVTKL